MICITGGTIHTGKGEVLENTDILIDNGKIVEEATPDEFFDNPKTERAKQFLNTFEFDSVRAKKELAE